MSVKKEMARVKVNGESVAKRGEVNDRKKKVWALYRNNTPFENLYCQNEITIPQGLPH